MVELVAATWDYVRRRMYALIRHRDSEDNCFEIIAFVQKG